MPEWLWKGIVLVVIGMIIDGAHGKLKEKYPRWDTIVLNGIRNAAYLGVLYFALTGHAISYKEPNPVTPANIMSRVTEWEQSLGQSVFHPPNDPVGLQVGIYEDVVSVFPLNSALRVQASVDFKPEQNKQFAKFSPTQTQQLSHDMKIEAAKLGTQVYSFKTYSDRIVVYKDMPIAEMMTREEFRSVEEHVQLSGIIMRDILDRDFQRIGTSKSP